MCEDAIGRDEDFESAIEDADFYRRRNEKLSRLVPGTFQWHYRTFLDAASIKDKEKRRRVEEASLMSIWVLEGKITHSRSFHNLHVLALAIESRSHDYKWPRARAFMWLVLRKMLSLRKTHEESVICLSLAGLMLPLRRFNDVCETLFERLFAGCEKCSDFVSLYGYCAKASQKMKVRNAIGRVATFAEIEELFMSQMYKYLNFSCDMLFHWMEKKGCEIEMESFWNRALASGSKPVKAYLKARKEKPPDTATKDDFVSREKPLFFQEHRSPGQRPGMANLKKDSF